MKKIYKVTADWPVSLSPVDIPYIGTFGDVWVDKTHFLSLWSSKHRFAVSATKEETELFYKMNLSHKIKEHC